MECCDYSLAESFSVFLSQSLLAGRLLSGVKREF